jgi:hypothetical protein
MAKAVQGELFFDPFEIKDLGIKLAAGSGIDASGAGRVQRRSAADNGVGLVAKV